MIIFNHGRIEIFQNPLKIFIIFEEKKKFTAKKLKIQKPNAVAPFHFILLLMKIRLKPKMLKIKLELEILLLKMNQRKYVLKPLFRNAYLKT